MTSKNLLSARNIHLITIILALIISCNSPNKKLPVEMVINFGHFHDIISVAISHDCKYISSGSFDHTAILWESESGNLIRIFKGHTSSVNSVKFNPKNSNLLTASSDKTVKLWDITTGEVIRTFNGHSNAVNSADFSSDGRFIVTGSSDNTAKIWEVSTGRELRTLTGHEDRINTIAFSPNGQEIVTGSDDGYAIVWNVYSGEEIRKFKGDDESEIAWFSSGVNFACFIPNGALIITCGRVDLPVKFWEKDSEKLFGSKRPHSSPVTAMCFDPKGSYIVSGSEDGTVQLWDLPNDAIMPCAEWARNNKANKNLSYKVHPGGVTSVAFSQDGHFFVTAGKDKRVLKWRRPKIGTDQDGERQLYLFKPDTLTCITTKIISASFSSDGNYLCMSKGDSTVFLWNLNATEKNRLLAIDPQKFLVNIGSEEITVVNFSPDSKFLIAGTRTGTIVLWEVNSGTIYRTVPIATSRIESIQFSPDGKYFATGGYEEVNLWDLKSGRFIKSLDVDSGYVNSISISPDGRYLLAGIGDIIFGLPGENRTFGYAILWEVETGKIMRVLKEFSNQINAVGFSPEGEYIAIGNSDTLRMLNINTYEEKFLLSKKLSGINCLKFDPTGRFLIIGDWHNQVRIWEIASGQELHSFEGHKNGIQTVDISPDGRFLLTTSEDYTAKIWDIETGVELATLLMLEGREWIVKTKEGNFDASSGALAAIHFVKGTEILEREKYYKKFYKPELLAKVMGNQ